jgi:hypothetical protein
MKTKILVLGMALSLFMIGCNKDDDNNNQTAPLTANEVKASAEMDDISDDVGYIAESQSDQTPAGKTADGPTFLGACAEITTTISGNIWTRTIDFGETNCTLFNGNTVRGKIIVTFTNDFDAMTRTVSYSFENFYHNDRHVEGNRTLVKTILPNPKTTITLDMTVTFEDGAVYHRTGERVREFTAGYDTFFNLYDNEFAVTGNWSTTFPSGNTQTATITAPLIIKWNCLHIVSGTVAFTRNANSAVLDYGDGTCDNQATVLINGELHTITLGLH